MRIAPWKSKLDAHRSNDDAKKSKAGAKRSRSLQKHEYEDDW